MQITLERLLYNLTNLAIKEKLVNYAAAGASFNGINGLTVRDYPLIFLQPNGQHKMEEDFTTYSLNMYFVDTHGKNDRCAGCVAHIKIKVLNDGVCYEE